MRRHEKVQKLLARDGKTDVALAKQLGLTPSQFSKRMKEPGTKNRVEFTPKELLAIARVFRVTLESLTDDTMDECVDADLPRDEETVLAWYRRLKAEEAIDADGALVGFGYAIKLKGSDPAIRPSPPTNPTMTPPPTVGTTIVPPNDGQKREPKRSG